MAPPIGWRLHLSASPDTVFDLWTTDAGRERFWAERSAPRRGGFDLSFADSSALGVDLVEARRPERFVFRYFGGSTVTIALAPDGRGGCDLTLIETGAPEPEQNSPGWVSLLLACKAACDFDIDLRNHDPTRSWSQGYVDN